MLDLGKLFMIVKWQFSKIVLSIKSGVKHKSRGIISTSTITSIKIRKCRSNFFFSSRSRHTSSVRDWSSDVCSSDLDLTGQTFFLRAEQGYGDTLQTIRYAPVLAEMTGAKVLHGPNADGEVAYAQTACEGDNYRIGQLEIRVMETPGHTFDHVAYALFDSEYPEKAVGVFTGDALFVGDVGRTDFYPDRKREVAGLLYDSLRKICDLGDQAIIYPAHGAGSVCGSGMAEREFSTVGHERCNNPGLQIQDREAFIDYKVGENHYQPPYFRLMERLNLEGGDPAPQVMRPKPISLRELGECGADHLIDIQVSGQ